MKHTATKSSSNKSTRLRWAVMSTLLASTLIAGCAAPVTKTVWVYEQPAGVTVQPVPARFGTVSRIEVVETRVGVTGAGAATGALLGGVLTSPMGHGGRGGGGPGFLPFALVGIAAGALIGNHIEQEQARAASDRHYQVYIDFDEGSTQVYELIDLNGLRAGERIKIERGQIKPAY